MEFAYGVPSYLRCSECGYAMLGETHRKDKSKFHAWCMTLKCPENGIKYIADAPVFALTKAEAE